MINDNCIMNNIIDLIKKYFSINDFLIKIKNDKTLLQKFISICGINYELFDKVIQQIYIKSEGNYKIKYCIEYKLILIFHLKNDFTNWKAITKSIFYEPLNNVKKHYKTIQTQYYRWCYKKVFQDVFYCSC